MCVFEREGGSEKEVGCVFEEEKEGESERCVFMCACVRERERRFAALLQLGL